MPKRKLKRDHCLYAVDFSQRLIRTDLWLAKAEELLDAAKLLEPEIRAYWSEVKMENARVVGVPNRQNIQGPYFMLVAYAIENYCKALLVHMKRKSLQHSLLRKLPGYLKEHDLLKLAAHIQLDLTVPEQGLLSRLTRNSIWSSRYPVPTGPTAMAAAKRFSDGRAYLTAYYGPEDLDLIHQFVRRLTNYVSEKIKGDT